jgi:hypothetical protein
MCIVAAVSLHGAMETWAQQQGNRTISGTRAASCIVRITSDSESLPMTDDLIGSLLESSPVAGAAARELLGWDSEQLGEEITIFFAPLTTKGPASQRNMIGRIDVELSEDLRPAAEEFLVALCKRLEAALVEVGAADEELWQRRLREVEEELGELESQVGKIREVQRELFEQAGRDDLSRARIENAVRDLEDQRHGIELRLAGVHAREKALAEQIAKVGQQAIEAAEKDAVAAELARVVEIRERQLQAMQMKVEAGLIPERETADLAEGLAHARADLARYREHAVETAGGGALSKLNQQLIEMSVETAEMKATLAMLEMQMEEIRARRLLELADRYEREVELQLKMCGDFVHDLTRERFRLKEMIRGLRRPEVIVIGAR